MAKPPPKGIKPTERHARQYDAMIRKIYLNPFIKGVESALEQIRADYFATREAIRNIPRDPYLAGKSARVAKAYITDLEVWHRKRITQTILRWWGIDGKHILQKGNIRAVMLEFIEENVNLITRLDRETRAKLLQTVEGEQLARPGDRNAIAKAVRKDMGIAGRRVKLIARDQTNKAVGQMNMTRQTELGIEKYEWSDSGDQRVRPLHRDNNGFTFSWEDPPITGHPGHAINCRCTAIPQMPAKPPDEVQSPAPAKWERETNG